MFSNVSEICNIATVVLFIQRMLMKLNWNCTSVKNILENEYLLDSEQIQQEQERKIDFLFYV